MTCLNLQKLDELLKVAERLSKPFQYVRIDLYEIEEQVKFGEFTFTPNSGVYQWNPQELDILWGVGMPRRISSAKLCVINCFERILDYD